MMMEMMIAVMTPAGDEMLVNFVRVTSSTRCVCVCVRVRVRAD